MDDYKDSTMIALLPISTDWCKIDLPHMTLVYSGDKAKLKPTAFNEMAKDAASIAMLASPITLEVTQKEAFGNWTDDPTDNVDVLRLRPSSELLAMRNMVERWNASEHPFNPHVTIGPVGTSIDHVPAYIAFDRIIVCWGNDHITFWLKR